MMIFLFVEVSGVGYDDEEKSNGVRDAKT